MLSRTADHLYWMARYMERAENTARMLDVNYQMSLLPQSEDAAERGWRGLLSISELTHDFAKRHGKVTPRSVIGRSCSSRSAGIEPLLARHQAAQAEQRADVRHRDREPRADLVDGADQRIDLERAAGEHVLQHRGLERAELARDSHALLARLRDRAADARADAPRLGRNMARWVQKVTGFVYL